MAKEKAAKTAVKSGKKDQWAKNNNITKLKPAVSEELVVDSDSEDEASAAKPTAKAAVKTSDKATKSEKKEKKSRLKAAPPPPPPPQESSPLESEESEDDEESGSDEEMLDTPVLKKPDGVPSKVNGVKRKAEEASSDNEEDEESSEGEQSDEPDQPVSKRTKTSSSKEDSSDEEETDDEQPTSTNPAATPAPTRITSTSIPAQPYKPPHGYSLLEVTSSTLSANDFAGKQVWHITAPYSVPLKSITEVALDTIHSGAPVLTHKGTEYAFIEDNSHSSQFNSVMVPTKTGYELVPQNIAKNLHLQQKIVLPNLSKKQADVSTGSNAAGDVAQPSFITARPQPKGMRMRFKPSGFGVGDAGLGSDEDEDEGGDEVQTKGKGKAFQFPKTLGVHGASEKPDGAETPKVKKSKKKRKSEDVEMVDADAGPGGAEEAQIPLRPSATPNEPLEKTSSLKKLSKAERKKHEEKRARKEAKAKTKGDR